MGRRGRRGGLSGGLVSMRGREGRGRRLGNGRDGPFLSVPRGPSGAWLGTLLRSLSILLFLFWAFLGVWWLVVETCLGILLLLLLFSSSGVV